MDIVKIDIEKLIDYIIDCCLDVDGLFKISKYRT